MDLFFPRSVTVGYLVFESDFRFDLALECHSLKYRHVLPGFTKCVVSKFVYQ